jgi:protocatechuate 3,4-dioxygenase beta subunit
MRAGRSGQFTFPDVAPGIYFLVAARDGYFPAAYGQRLPTGRGTPIQVTAESKLFGELRMRRKGAITGRVFDENGVAATGVPVVAYRARLPLESSGSGTSDDRGIYRIHSLEPGQYWVRSGAHALDDGSGWLPTYGFQGRELRDARIHRVTVDSDTPDADVSPDSGKLFRLSGLILCDKDGPVTVTLSSETGRRRTQTACKGGYRFEGLAPAGYEVFAALQDGTAAGFIEMFLGGDFDAGNVRVFELPRVETEVRHADSNSLTDTPIALIGRRQNLAGTERPHEIATPHTTLAPGY